MKKNVIAEPNVADIASELSTRIGSFFTQHAHPKYDLWQGGSAKSNSDKPWLWQDAWGEGWQTTYRIIVPNLRFPNLRLAMPPNFSQNWREHCSWF